MACQLVPGLGLTDPPPTKAFPFISRTETWPVLLFWKRMSSDLLNAPIEITGFSPAEIDHVILGEAADGLEQGPLEPDPATTVARVGDMFQLGPHRIVCGMRPILRFLVDCWKATGRPVSS